MKYRDKVWKDISHLEGIARDTKEIETAVRKSFKKHGLVSACRDYPMPDGTKFPGYICASVNLTKCHGIPNHNIIDWETDVVNIDICFKRPDGMYEDNCQSWGGQWISLKSIRLTHYLEHCLHFLTTHKEIAQKAKAWCIKHEVRLVTSFGGHYIGNRLHIDFIGYDVNYANKQKVFDLPEGATGFTIEPIIQDYETDQYAQTEIQIDVK